MSFEKITIIIPTYNAQQYLEKQLEIIRNQTIKNLDIIVIDSSSQDKTVEKARSFGAKILVIPQAEFEHGGTRTYAGKLAEGEILVYLTQDSLPGNIDAIENLIMPFYKDEKIGATYGRQLPCPDATPIAEHLRLFNYSETSYVRTLLDKEIYGIKAAFLSNSFAAYRKQALDKIGWFKGRIIIGEDMYAGANLLMSGYKLAYIADAVVYHSHNYSVRQEFERYFDIGVFHRTENLLLKTFGKPESEGVRYAISELKYLIRKRKIYLIPESVVRNAFKFIAYTLGYYYNILPSRVIKKISLNKKWWN